MRRELRHPFQKCVFWHTVSMRCSLGSMEKRFPQSSKFGKVCIEQKVSRELWNFLETLVGDPKWRRESTVFPRHLLLEDQEGFWLQVNRKSSPKEVKLSREVLAHTIGSPEMGTSRIWQPNNVTKARAAPPSPSPSLSALFGMVTLTGPKWQLQFQNTHVDTTTASTDGDAFTQTAFMSKINLSHKSPKRLSSTFPWPEL